MDEFGGRAYEAAALDPMTDIEIARTVELQKISTLASEKLGLSDEQLISYGRHKAKVDLETLTAGSENKPGKLILVTAISPTPAGEG